MPYKLRKLGDIAAKVKSVSPVVAKIAKPVWNRVAYRDSRVFDSRSQLSAIHQRMIVNSLELEIDSLAELMGKDLDHWKRIRP